MKMKPIAFLKLHKSMKPILKFHCSFNTSIPRSCDQKLPRDLSTENFATIIGTDHSYVKMNWNQCFTLVHEVPINHQEIKTDADSIHSSDRFKVMLSKINIEKDDSDYIEEMKMINNSVLST